MSVLGRPTQTPTSADLADLLAGLGSTSTEVARSLAHFGVRGVPADIHQCAIALYLNAVVGGDRHVRSVAVWNDRVRVSFGHLLGRAAEVPLTPCLREFIDRFDAFNYPDLLRSGVAAAEHSKSHG
jgi:hypothetical protein